MQSPRRLASIPRALALLSLTAPAWSAQGAEAPAPLAELALNTAFGLPLIEVSVDGSAPRLVGVDTGATQTFLDRGWLEELEVPIQEMGSSQQPGGVVRIGRATGLDLGLGDSSWTGRAVGAVDMQHLEGAIGLRLYGILGHDLFRAFVVELDYGAGVLRLHKPATFVAAESGEEIPLTFVGTKPLVAMRITRRDGTELEASILLDTGSTQALTLAPHFRPRVLVPGQARLEARGWGFGGKDSIGLQLRTRAARLGSHVFENLVTYSRVNDGTRGKSSWDGLIGGELLRRFRVVIDYSRSVMLLEPNGALEEPVAEPLTGMELSAEGDGGRAISVFHVYADSIAARAGVEAGDVLLAVDGEPVVPSDLAALWSRLRRTPGPEHDLRLRRGEREFEVTLRLARLEL